MDSATPSDIIRLLPGIQDHTVVEIRAMQATVGELEAAVQLLQDDEGLMEVKQEMGDRLNLLLGILAKAEIRPQDEPRRGA